jgi:protein phosphatase
MGNTLFLQMPEKSKIVERKKENYLNAATCCTNGFRKNMEDKHCMVSNDNNNGKYIFGIFDGHVNDKCSDYISKNLPDKLLNLSSDITPKEIENIYIDIDNQYNINNTSNNGGTTAVLISIDIKENENEKVSIMGTICNLGDSRCMIIRNNKIFFLTNDHKPCNKIESERIIKAGGFVKKNRVDGDFSLSRAFGDSNYKLNKILNDNDPYNFKMICIPDVTQFELYEDDIIFLGCDGVFEGKFSNKDVSDFICDRINGSIRNKNFVDYPIDIGCICAEICDQAIERGSKDNISCMIIQITKKNVEKLQFEPKSFIPGIPPTINDFNSIDAFNKMLKFANVTMSQALEHRYKLLTNKDKLLPPQFTELESHTFDFYNDDDFVYETSLFSKILLNNNNIFNDNIYNSENLSLTTSIEIPNYFDN